MACSENGTWTVLTKHALYLGSIGLLRSTQHSGAQANSTWPYYSLKMPGRGVALVIGPVQLPNTRKTVRLSR